MPRENPRLRFSADSEPGLRRRDGTRGPEYLDAAGRKVRKAQVLERVKSLAIPPAWTDVWICADERGHLQATGRDARGRKQYRYHPRWREMRDAHKFDRMIDFAAALPAVRRRVRLDLEAPGLPRRKVLAALVRLLETTCLRIGNERYAEQNDSFGLTTLRNRHARVSGPRVEFQFRGKAAGSIASPWRTRGLRASCAAAGSFRGRRCSNTSTKTARCRRSARPT